MLTVITVIILELLVLLTIFIVSILQTTGYAVPVILLRLMLNTTPPLQGFHLETSCFLLMPPQHITQISNSSVRCQRLINHLQLSINNMCPCHECVSCNLVCHVGKESDKCLKCVWSTRRKCDWTYLDRYAHRYVCRVYSALSPTKYLSSHQAS